MYSFLFIYQNDPQNRLRHIVQSMKRGGEFDFWNLLWGKYTKIPRNESRRSFWVVLEKSLFSFLYLYLENGPSLRRKCFLIIAD